MFVSESNMAEPLSLISKTSDIDTLFVMASISLSVIIPSCNFVYVESRILHVEWTG